MKFKKTAVIALCLMLALGMSGCSGKGLRIDAEQPEGEIAALQVPYTAPIGDSAMEYTKEAVFYLPTADGKALSPMNGTVTYSPSRTRCDALVRALLNLTPDAEHSPLGFGTKISLYGSTPVEVCRNTAVIHLSASIKQLDMEQQYTVCAAIAETVCANTDITDVSFLSGERPFALDISNTMPCGSFVSDQAQDPSAAYRRKHTLAASEPNEETLRAILYFPVAGSGGVMASGQTLKPEAKSMDSLILSVLDALGTAPENDTVRCAPLPDLRTYLTATPAIVDSDDARGKAVALSFCEEWKDALADAGVSEEEAVAALCMTMSTYFPDVTGILLNIGGEKADPSLLVEPGDDAAGTLYLRSECAPKLLDTCVLYLPGEKDGLPVKVYRPIAYTQTQNPKALLKNLCTAPLPYDSRTDTLPALPADAFKDTSVLGMCCEEDVLILNFALTFLKDSGLSADVSAQAAAYSMVNTLCEMDSAKAVCFLQAGSWFEPNGSGDLYWPGIFYPMPIEE